MIGLWRGLVAAVMAVFLGVALAEAASAQLLDEIIKNKKVRVAIDLGVPPFGMMNAKNEPDGSDVDFAKLFAQDLGVELEVVPTQVANRVSVLLTGKADVVISNFGMTYERARAVSFSSPVGRVEIVIFGPKSVQISKPQDLVGKRIGATRGTIDDIELTKAALPGTTIVRFDEYPAMLNALINGQVDAITTFDTLSVELTKKYPDKQYEVKFGLLKSFHGIGIRRGDPDFMQWINTWVFLHNQRGEIAKIFDKWTGLSLGVLPSM